MKQKSKYHFAGFLNCGSLQVILEQVFVLWFLKCKTEKTKFIICFREIVNTSLYANFLQMFYSRKKNHLLLLKILLCQCLKFYLS